MCWGKIKWNVIITITLSILILDLLYFFFNRNYFGKFIQNVQKSPCIVKYLPAALVYIILIAFEYFFIIMQKKTILEAFFVGFAIYAIYDLTNYATLSRWPLYVVIMDSLWGGFIFSFTTYIVYKLN
jgi:uncharacterized membrane protein